MLLSQAVDNLASKLTLVLFPPSQKIFKQELKRADMDRLVALLSQPEFAESLNIQEDVDLEKEINLRLARDTVSIMQEINETPIRALTFKIFRYLIVTGNCLPFIPDNLQEMQAIRPDKYVVSRDNSGNVLNLIVKMGIDQRLISKMDETQVDPNEIHESDISVFTSMKLIKGDMYLLEQATSSGIQLFKPRKTNFLESPFMEPLRWVVVDGENYGRGHVEQFFGGISTFEGLEQLMLKGTSAVAKVLPFLRPGSTTTIEDITEKETGEVIRGDPEDYEIKQASGKISDFSVVASKSDSIARQIKEAFLMTSSVQRDAERVTAEEFSTLAKELDERLGGMFTVQSNALVKPFVEKVRFRQQQNGDVTVYPKNMNVLVKLFVGMEALGRGQELNNLTRATDVLANYGLMDQINRNELTNRILSAHGVDTENLVFSPKQIAQQQKISQQQEIERESASSVVNQIGSTVRQAVSN